MLKKILIIGGIVAGVVLIGCVVLGWWAYLVFTGPFYEPGTLANAQGLQGKFCSSSHQADQQKQPGQASK